MGSAEKDEPNCVVAGHVIFDGTCGISGNNRTRIRDQQLAPIAADLKRIRREKSLQGKGTFALTADVSEAILISRARSGRLLRPIIGVEWHRGLDVFLSVVQHREEMAPANDHDFHLDGRGPEYRPAVIKLFAVCASQGVDQGGR